MQLYALKYGPFELQKQCFLVPFQSRARHVFILLRLARGNVCVCLTCDGFNSCVFVHSVPSSGGLLWSLCPCSATCQSSCFGDNRSDRLRCLLNNAVLITLQLSTPVLLNPLTAQNCSSGAFTLQALITSDHTCGLLQQVWCLST